MRIIKKFHISPAPAYTLPIENFWELYVAWREIFRVQQKCNSRSRNNIHMLANNTKAPAKFSETPLLKAMNEIYHSIYVNHDTISQSI